MHPDRWWACTVSEVTPQSAANSSPLLSLKKISFPYEITSGTDRVAKVVFLVKIRHDRDEVTRFIDAGAR